MIRLLSQAVLRLVTYYSLRNKRLYLLCVTLVFIKVGLSQMPQQKYTLVITNASVVDVQNNKIFSNRLLAISHDTIKVVDDTKQVDRYSAEQYIDAKGKYVLPGLWDMHVHFGIDSLRNENKALLPMFLAYGVTTVRDCGADMTKTILQWQKQIASGSLVGPKIYTTGPKIDGAKHAKAEWFKVTTRSDIPKALDSLQRLGVTCIKLYEISIAPDLYLETIRQARKRGLQTSGHLPPSVKVAEAGQAGLGSIEHIIFTLSSASSKEDSIAQIARDAVQRRKWFNSAVNALPIAYNTYSSECASNLVQTLAFYHTAVVPTLYVFKTYMVDIFQTDHSHDSLLVYIDPKFKKKYGEIYFISKRLPEQTIQQYKTAMQQFMEVLPQMQAAGVMLIAGTDCAPSQPYIYPGESMHQELKLYVEAGLTPAQALQTATINGAKFMGVDNFYGTIQAGKSSDLIILEENPLKRIDAIDKIHMVLSNGKLYTASELNNMLQKFKQ